MTSNLQSKIKEKQKDNKILKTMTRKKKTTNASAQESPAAVDVMGTEDTMEEVKGAEIETPVMAGPPLQSKISYIPDEGQTYSYATE